MTTQKDIIERMAQIKMEKLTCNVQTRKLLNLEYSKLFAQLNRIGNWL